MKSKSRFDFGPKFTKLKGYFMLFLALLLVLSIIRNIGKVIAVRGEVEAERLKIEKLRKDNEALAQKIAENQGPEFIEKEVRDKLGLVKTGETVVILPDTETLKKLAPVPPLEDDTLPDPNWKKWEKLFL